MDPEVERYLATFHIPNRNDIPRVYVPPEVNNEVVHQDYFELGDIIGIQSWPNYIRCKLMSDSFNYPSRAYWATFVFMNGLNIDAFCTYTKIVNVNLNGIHETEIREVYRWLGENPIQASKYYAYDLIRHGVYYFNGERKHSEGFVRQFPKSQCEIELENIINQPNDGELDYFGREWEIFNHFFSDRYGRIQPREVPQYPYREQPMLG